MEDNKSKYHIGGGYEEATVRFVACKHALLTYKREFLIYRILEFLRLR
jgi:hypothetical protein